MRWSSQRIYLTWTYSRYYYWRRRLSFAGKQNTLFGHYSPYCRSGNKRPNQGCPLPARKRLPENSHRRCYRKTGRPHIRKYQFAAGLYEKRYGSTNRYGLRSIYSGKRHADFRFSHRPANFHYQFRSERIERGRIGLSA